MSIIKCPECGQRVSTMAGTCPHCGVSIAGNLKECPNCHSYCLNSQDVCPNCSASMSVITTEEVVPASKIEIEKEGKKVSIESKSETKKTARKRNHGALAITFIICAILIICCVYLLNRQQRQNKEESDFIQLENVTNPEYYNQFLIDYPDSKHYTEVKERMQSLVKENQQWLQIVASKKRADIVQFQQEFPNSVRKRLCEDMLDTIDWNEAQTIGTEESATHYLEAHPEGIFAAEATDLRDMKAKVKVTEQDKTILRGIIETFANALAKQDVSQITAAIPQTMSNFNGTPDANSEQIASYTNAKMEKDVIGLHYLVSDDFNITKEIMPDGAICYVTVFSLNETITRSDANQPISKTYQVTARINADRKITSWTTK